MCLLRINNHLKCGNEQNTSNNICFISNVVGEYGDHFEGDMILTEQMDDLFSPARNGKISTKYRWPNKIIPYRLSKEHTKQQRNYIERALKQIESMSCLTFRRQRNEEHYIEITVSYSRLCGLEL